MQATLRFPLIMLLALALGAALVPARAGAQTPPTRSMTVNQLTGSGWPTVRINLNLRSLNNTALGDVGPDQFVVEENGVAQQVTDIALGAASGAPLSVVLVLDTSGSMEGEKLAAAQAAGSAFLKALGPQDAAALVPFNTQVGAVTAFTTDKDQVAAALNAQTAKGNTAVYDALKTAALLAGAAPEGNRRAVVLLTDGRDTSSRSLPDLALATARQHDVLVYTIGVGTDTDDQVLTALSEPTGGRNIKATDPATLKGIYEELAKELTGQYLLTYTSTTRVTKNYETILVRVRYTAPGGEAIVQEIRYRPPSTALGTATPAPTLTPVPIPQVAIPLGLVQARPDLPAGPGAPASADASAGLRALLTVLSALAALLAVIAVLLIVGALIVSRSPTAMKARVDRFVAETDMGVPGNTPPPGFTARVLYPFFNGLGRRLGAFTPARYLDQIQALLYQAGPPYRMTRTGFLGLQAGWGLILALLALLWAALLSHQPPFMWLVLAALGLAIGLYLPYFSLARRVTARKKRVLRAMPAALDFMAIMVEAGMGFDAALNELVRRWRNTLTDEFALLLIDFQIGKPRRTAWQELSHRTEVPDLNSFVVAMIQSEQTGISIGDLLRTQAEQIRIRRRQRAEEEARMAPVKMLIPMALLIFPTILMVILGPALPQLFGSISGLTH